MAQEATGMPDRYDIRITGHLADRWAAHFDGMTLIAQPDGTTVIHGAVADQSALHGLLRKLSDLGVPLVAVERLAEHGEPNNPAGHSVARQAQKGTTT
jgi:hypothetical protein